MSRPNKMGMIVAFMTCFAALATLFVVDHVEGAKSGPVTPISLTANLEPIWYGAGGETVVTTIRNDVDNQLYIDRTDTKRIKYGVSVKYTPAGGSNPRGQFVMKIDRAGALGRYVQLHFSKTATGLNCVSSQEGCAVGGFMGDTGDVETRTISISTQLILAENAAGQLVRDVNSPLGMETMKTGDRKVVGLGISFTPDVDGFDYQYDLGQFTDPANYVPGVTCQEQNYPWGPAELVCLASGQIWEFRPCSVSYVNEPNNLWRLLWGHVLLDYWTFCRLDKWEMPFVLRVTRQ